MHPRAAELVRKLGLAPHPEGGFFAETFRSTARVRPSDGRGERSAMTAIHFLLAAGQASRWHAIASDEVWQLEEGGGLELLVAPPGLECVARVELGPLDAGRGPSHVVRAGEWQAARPLGEYALVTCTVAPGFEFADFRFLVADADAAARLRALDPALAALL